jgi:hypothetical protein
VNTAHSLSGARIGYDRDVDVGRAAVDQTCAPAKRSTRASSPPSPSPPSPSHLPRALCRVRTATLYERLAAMTADGRLIKSADGYQIAAR